MSVNNFNDNILESSTFVAPISCHLNHSYDSYFIKTVLFMSKLKAVMALIMEFQLDPTANKSTQDWV